MVPAFYIAIMAAVLVNMFITPEQLTEALISIGLHRQRCDGVCSLLSRTRRMMWQQTALEVDGYAFLRGVFSAEAITDILVEWTAASRAVCDRHCTSRQRRPGPSYGARGTLLELWPRVVELVRVPVLQEALRDVLGEAAGVACAIN